MSAEVQTYGFWVAINGKYCCDFINEGTEVVRSAFNDGYLRDEFEAFVTEKISHLTAWSFIMQDGDFSSEYEDWIEEFISKKCRETFVEGRDVQFLGVAYHWETIELPTSVSFWDYADKHEDEYHEKYKDDFHEGSQ